MTPFDMQRMLLHEFPLMFVAEVALRALLAFVAVFVFLKVSGRRGIRQLSVFELVIILTLGSAAGDVSFYEDVPLLPVAAVFATLLALYRLTVFFMNRSPRFEAWLEGHPVTIIRDGIYELRSLDSLNISADEFFMELRQQGVEHLGQVRLGILENDGNVSLFFHETTRYALDYPSSRRSTDRSSARFRRPVCTPAAAAVFPRRWRASKANNARGVPIQPGRRRFPHRDRADTRSEPPSCWPVSC